MRWHALIDAQVKLSSREAIHDSSPGTIILSTDTDFSSDENDLPAPRSTGAGDHYYTKHVNDYNDYREQQLADVGP